MRPTIEELLTLAPPGPYWYCNSASSWCVTKNGDAYCSYCVLRALNGRSETIEAIGLRDTDSKKKLGVDPRCKHCGRRKIYQESPNSNSEPPWSQKRGPLVRERLPDSSRRATSILSSISRWLFPNLQNEYVARDSLIRRMGFENYYEYLDSPDWRSIRKEVFAKHKGVCFACKSRAQVIHHRNYREETLSGKDLSAEAMVPVCRLCHRIAEVLDSGEKLCLEDANRRLDTLTRAFHETLANTDLEVESKTNKLTKLCFKVEVINRVFPEGLEPSEERRDAWLEALGFGCYEAFLNSDFWNSIRHRALDNNDWRCCRCAQRASQAHIRNYRFNTLAGIDLNSESLVVVCDRCWVFAWLSRPGMASLLHANALLKTKC